MSRTQRGSRASYVPYNSVNRRQERKRERKRGIVRKRDEEKERERERKGKYLRLIELVSQKEREI